MQQQSCRDVAEEAVATKVVGAESDATHKMKEKESKHIHISTVYFAAFPSCRFEVFAKEGLPEYIMNHEGRLHEFGSISEEAYMLSHFICGHGKVWSKRNEQLLETEALSMSGTEWVGKLDAMPLWVRKLRLCFGDRVPLHCCWCAEEFDEFFSAPHKLIELVLQGNSPRTMKRLTRWTEGIVKRTWQEGAVFISSPQGSV